ncbi:hypothetical protein D3C72_1573020 [compost metagenome]
MVNQQVDGKKIEQLTRRPFVEVVGRQIHFGRERTTVVAGGTAAHLHALYRSDVLGEHHPPRLHDGLACRVEAAVEGLVADIEETQVLDGLTGRDRLQHHGEGVIRLDAQQDVGEEGDILRRAQAVSRPGGEDRQVGTGDIGQVIGVAALAGELVEHDVVVIFQARVAVQARVHPRQVIGLTVVLDC